MNKINHSTALPIFEDILNGTTYNKLEEKYNLSANRLRIYALRGLRMVLFFAKEIPYTLNNKSIHSAKQHKEFILQYLPLAYERSIK